MEVPAGQDGIQQLLVAEQEAQAIVATARKAKNDRLKEAKQEAEKEIESYKLEKEEEFKKKIAEDSSASQDTATKLAQQADADVAAVETHVSAKQQQVLDLLLKYVTSS